MSLLQSHPVLVILRDINAWWDLGAWLAGGRLDGDAVAAALAAWIADDRERGDDAGAAAHEAFARDVACALEIGVPEAFAERAAARQVASPEAFREGIRRVDSLVLEHLQRGRADALTAAAVTLDELITTGGIDDAEPPFQLALFSDGARLFDSALAESQDDEMLRRVIGCCDVAIRLRRDWDQHPAGGLLNLDPRLQATAGLLGTRLGARYARAGDAEDLKRAIQMAEAGLSLTGPLAPDHPLRLSEHAKALGFRNDEASLTIANKSLADALDLEPRSSPLRATLTVQYGSGLVELSRYEGFQGLLQKGIETLREAQLDPCGSSDPALSYRLGDALLLLHERGGDGQQALDDAADLLAEVVRSKPRPLPPGDQHLEALYRAVERLADRYRATRDQAVLERTLRGLLVAVTGTATMVGEPAQWLARELDMLLALGAGAPGAIAVFGSAALETYSRTKEEVYGDCALRLLRVASAAESDSKRRSGHLAELASALALRYDREGSEADLEEAIERAEAAVVSALDAADRHAEAVARNALGALLSARFDRSGNTDDLDAAIAQVECAVADRELLEPEDRAGFLSNLGALMRTRAAHLPQPGDEERALGILLEAFAIAQKHHTTNLRSCVHNLANARHALFQRSRRGRHLDQAIGDWRRALDLENPPEPATLLGLARALVDRHVTSRKAHGRDLDEAIRLLEGALDDSGERSRDRPACGSELARALELRARRGGGDADVRRARELSRAACELALDVALEHALYTGYDWGERATTRRAWDEAVEAYAYGIRALQLLVGPQVLRAGKLSWLRHGWGPSANAAYALAKTGDPATAAVALEGTRGLLISEARALERSRLEKLEGGPYGLLAERFRTAVGQWGAVARRTGIQAGSAGADVDAARSAVEEAIHAIREIPGFESFLGYPTIDDIRAAAVEPLVYFVAARLGGVALIVRPDGSDVEAVWLPRLTEKRVRAEAEGFVAAYRGRNRARAEWVARLDDLGEWLWEVAMRPLFAHLRARRFVVVPTGLLGLLPLHAAWVVDAGKADGRRYAIDDAVISFASTAQALLAGQKLAALVDPSAALAVQSPEPVSLPSLPNAEGEAAAAAAAFERSERLAARDATVENIVPAMAEHPVLHFACHALSSIEDPARSGIVVAFGRLLDPGGLAMLPLAGTRLVVLSACESGVYGGQIPDEAVGLPSAFIEAGAAGVVASLWEVADASTMILIVRFYELWRREGHDVAEALVEAQHWLRETTNAEKQSHWLEAWRRGTLPEATYDAMTADQLFRDPGARDFEHPVHWGAFTFTGAW